MFAAVTLDSAACCSNCHSELQARQFFFSPSVVFTLFIYLIFLFLLADTNVQWATDLPLGCGFDSRACRLGFSLWV